MNVVHEDVEKLVDKELEAATERFGLHHSHHEKYAVINEEYDEVCEESRILGNAVSHLWAQIKANDTETDINTTYDAMYQFAVNLSCEAIQVAAMCKKEIDEAVDAIPREKWNELKETIIEMRDSGGTATQNVVCKFLTNLMEILEN